MKKIKRHHRYFRASITELIIISLCGLFLSACQSKSSTLKPGSPEDLEGGEVYLYVQTFPQEADRLSFSLAGITAVRDDGREFHLSLILPEFNSSVVSRQRLAASGRLPEGSYTGFSFRAGSASVRTEEGKADLLMSAEPSISEFQFDIRSKSALVISLTLNYSRSVADGVTFHPVFAASLPMRPVVGLLGYAVNSISDNITVFDKKARVVTGVIMTGKGPSGIAIDRNLKRAYVTLSSDDSVEVVDMTAGRIISSTRLTAGDRPREPALTPDSSLIFTANSGSDTVSIIDAASMIELSRIPVGNGPNSILIGRDGRRAYVFNTLSSSISVIDIANRSVAATVSAESGPLSGQLSRDGTRLYVIHSWSSYLTVMDPFSLSVLKRVPVGNGAVSLKLDTRTNLLYVGMKHDSIGVYEPFSMIPIENIKTEGGASFITIDDEGNALYLSVPEMNTLTVIDIINRAVIDSMDIGQGAEWVSMMGER